MLDLNPGVHLDEVELAVLVEKLEGAGAAVADAATGLGAAFADGVALLRRDPGGWGLLDHLLVPALHGAVAFTQMDGLALAIGEELELDVAGILQIFFHVNHGIAEGGHGLCPGQGDGVEEGGLGVDDPHAPPAAPARGLDDDRVADLPGQLEGALLVLVQGAVGAGHARDAGGLHGADGGDLVAHEADGLGPGADEDETALLHPLGEVGVLRQEAIARMNGHRVRDFGGADDGGDVQIAARRGGGADADGLVRQQDVLEFAVGLGVDGDGLDSELTAGAQNAQRDFPSVGDEQLLDHGDVIRVWALVETAGSRFVGGGKGGPARQGDKAGYPRRRRA